MSGIIRFLTNLFQAVSSQNKQPSSSLTHGQRHSSNQSSNAQAHASVPHGVHPSVSVPGSHQSSTHSQGNIPSNSNVKHGTHPSSSHASRPQGHPSAMVDKSIRSGLSHRHG